jgi:thioredoxin reductase
MPADTQCFDVVIVGAGPAGLSAALILGRCLRRVLLIDDGTPRSWAAHEVHGFLSRDGIEQAEFRRVCRLQLEKYPNVEQLAGEVHRIEPRQERFEIHLRTGGRARCRKVLLATGVLDELPPLPRIEDYFGISAFPCPYCDGWEAREAVLAVYGDEHRGVEMARAMTAWSERFTLITGGWQVPPADRRALAANAVDIIEAPIEKLLGAHGRLHGVRFTDGRTLPVDALFFDTPSVMQSALAFALGCRTTASGRIECGAYAETSVAGVYAAGNVVEGVQLSIVAASDGARAAFGINRALTRERFEARSHGIDPAAERATR